MNIRPAQEHEAEALSALAREAKAYWGYSPDMIESWRQELSVSSDTITLRPTFVAAVGEEIAGFYCLVPSRLLERLGFSPASPEKHVRHRLEPRESLMLREIERI